MALSKFKRYQCRYCGAVQGTFNGFSPLKTKCYKAPTGFHSWERES